MNSSVIAANGDVGGDLVHFASYGQLPSIGSSVWNKRASKPQHQPMFREGSKAAQVLTLLSRPEGATLNEIRTQTGWQAHTVRGFISRNLSKQSRKVRSFERDDERVYRIKV